MMNRNKNLQGMKAKATAQLTDDAVLKAHVGTSLIGLVAAEDSEFGTITLCWMPGGVHDEVPAGTDVPGQSFEGAVLVDQVATNNMQADLNAALADGRRPFIDENHSNNGATGWIKEFFFDAAKGIMARVELSARGKACLQGKEYFSFSPTCLISRVDRRPSRFMPANSAGGLTNNPAFGSKMPALIAKHHTNTPEVNTTTMKLEELIALLAALGKTAPTGATIEQLIPLVAEAVKGLKATAPEFEGLKAKITAFEDAYKADKTAKVDAVLEAAIADGRIQAADKAVWAAEPNAIALVAKLPKPVKANTEAAFTATIVTGSSVEDAFKAMRAIEKNPSAGGRSLNALGRIVGVRNIEACGRAVQRGEIFNSVFAKIVASKDYCFGRDIYKALVAADGQGNTNSTLITDYLSQEHLFFLKLALQNVMSFSTNVSPAEAKLNQQVLVPILSTILTKTKVPGQPYESSPVTDAHIPVTINKHIYNEVSYEVDVLSNTDRQLHLEHQIPQVYSLATAVLTEMYALMTAANFTEAATVQALKASATDYFGQETVADMATALNKRGVNPVGRTLLLNDDYYGQLSKDPSLATVFTAAGLNVLGENQITGNVRGMRPALAQQMPDSATNGNIVGGAFAKDAFCFASRIPAILNNVMGGAGNGIQTTFIDPESGLSMLTTRYVDHSNGVLPQRNELMFGVAPGQGKSGQILKSESGS